MPLRLFYLTLTCACFLALNQLAGPTRALLEIRGPSSGQKLISEIDDQTPHIVLLGNSMLGEGVDADALSERLKLDVLKLDRAGNATAMWYLMLKNGILKANHKPQMVLLFFRDSVLTRPDFRVTGKHKAHLDLIAGEREPVLDRLAYRDRVDRLTFFLQQYLSLYSNRVEIKSDLENFVKNAASARFLGLPIGEAQEAIDRTFADEKLDQGLLTKAQLSEEKRSLRADLDFAREADRSFLPYIINLAQEVNVQMVMVRVKKLRDADGRPRSDGLDRYIADLSHFLESQSVPLLDFSDDPRLRIEHYAASDHLNEDGRKVFTEILAKRISDLRQTLDLEPVVQD